MNQDPEEDSDSLGWEHMTGHQHKLLGLTRDVGARRKGFVNIGTLVITKPSCQK